MDVKQKGTPPSHSSPKGPRGRYKHGPPVDPAAFKALLDKGLTYELILEVLDSSRALSLKTRNAAAHPVNDMRAHLTERLEALERTPPKERKPELLLVSLACVIHPPFNFPKKEARALRKQVESLIAEGAAEEEGSKSPQCGAESMSLADTESNFTGYAGTTFSGRTAVDEAYGPDPLSRYRSSERAGAVYVNDGGPVRRSTLFV